MKLLEMDRAKTMLKVDNNLIRFMSLDLYDRFGIVFFFSPRPLVVILTLVYMVLLKRSGLIS